MLRAISTDALPVVYTAIAGLAFASVFVTLQSRKRRIDKSHKQRSTREAAVSAVQKAKNDTQTELTALKEELTRKNEALSLLEAHLAASRSRSQALSDRVISLTRDTRRLSEELQRETRAHAETTELLEHRTKELHGSQVFLTKADRFSGAEIIAMIESLNADIFQTAASMADALVDLDGRSSKVDVGAVREGSLKTAEIIGNRMAELLRSSSPHEDLTFIIQTALQAALAACAHWVISSWCFRMHEDEHLLGKIYDRLRESEEQAVFGRWRSLTRTHIQQISSTENDLSLHMTQALVSVLLSTGMHASSAALRKQIEKDFGESISLILRASKQIKKAIGEGVTSCDIETSYILPDITFNPETMEDTSDLRQGDQGDTVEGVLCTTDLGLMRLEKKSGATGKSVLLKPKIVLLSGLSGLES